jgi:hypothetical protein
MLHRFHDLKACTIHTDDEDIGAVKDLYFDDLSTAIRYFVVDTGHWLPGRKVLLAPAALRHVDEAESTLNTVLTRQQIEDSPGVEEDRPVSRQEEIRLHAHYGWDPYWLIPPSAAGIAPYWGGFGAAGLPPIETRPGRGAAEEEALLAEQAKGDAHLRSANEVRGYEVEARNGDVGRVDDFLVDEEHWAIAFLVVETGSWLSSRPILLAPAWLEGIDWANRQITVGLDKEQIRSSPAYEHGTVVDREYQRRLFAHYDRPPLA